MIYFAQNMRRSIEGMELVAVVTYLDLDRDRAFGWYWIVSSGCQNDIDATFLAQWRPEQQLWSVPFILGDVTALQTTVDVAGKDNLKAIIGPLTPPEDRYTMSGRPRGYYWLVPPENNSLISGPKMAIWNGSWFTWFNGHWLWMTRTDEELQAQDIRFVGPLLPPGIIK